MVDAVTKGQWTMRFIAVAVVSAGLISACALADHTVEPAPTRGMPVASEEPAALRESDAPVGASTTGNATHQDATPWALGRTSPKAVAPVVAASVIRHWQPIDSPDGRWRAQVFGYDIIPAFDGAEIEYEELVLTDRHSGDEFRVADSVLDSDRIGAAGLEGLFWDHGSRHFYYTDARIGSPEGCGYWGAPITVADVVDRTIRHLGDGPRSPSGDQLALWHYWGVSPPELVIWDVSEGELFRVPAAHQDASLQSLEWSDNGQLVAYLMTTSSCWWTDDAIIGVLDVASREHAAVIESPDVDALSLRWHGERELLLCGVSGSWIVDIDGKNLESVDGAACTPAVPPIQ